MCMLSMCSENTETTERYLLRCQLYADRCEILFDTMSSIIQNDVFAFQENNYLCSLLLYGDPHLNEISTHLILESIFNLFITLVVSLATCDSPCESIPVTL